MNDKPVCQYKYPDIFKDPPWELCGRPADPKSKQVAGMWLCGFHLEEYVRGLI